MAANTTLSAFLESTYDETLALLEDVRDYIANARGEAESDLSASQRALIIRELSRVTWQMTEIMAWLLLRKAVEAGEMDDGEAAAHEASRLALVEGLGEEMPGIVLAELPFQARGLIDRGSRIFAQATRLEEGFEKAS